MVLVVNDNQLSELSDFLNTCTNSKINFEVIIIYNGKPENVPAPSYKHLLLTKKEFTFFNLPKETALHPLSNITYDVLINISSHEQLQALTISKLIKAKCKIANYEDVIFDISINANNNIKDF